MAAYLLNGVDFALYWSCQKSVAMQRLIFPLVAVGLFASGSASAQLLPTTPQMVVMVPAPQEIRGNLGGGFIEYLFGDQSRPQLAPPPHIYSNPAQGNRPLYANTSPQVDPLLEPPGTAIDPQ